MSFVFILHCLTLDDFSPLSGVMLIEELNPQFFISFLLESLIEAIQSDIRIAQEELDKAEHQTYNSHSFLTDKSLTRKSEVVLG